MKIYVLEKDKMDYDDDRCVLGIFESLALMQQAYKKIKREHQTYSAYALEMNECDGYDLLYADSTEDLEGWE